MGVRLDVRLPDDMHTQLVEDARKEGRSLNAEIVARLRGEGPMRQVLENVAGNSEAMIRWLQEGNFRAIPDVIRFLETARGFALAALDGEKAKKGGE